MRIVHAIRSLSRQEAGLFYFVNDLTRWQSALGCEVVVVALQDRDSAADAVHWGHVSTELLHAAGPRCFSLAPQAAGTLARLKPDVVHCHGLWTSHSLTMPSYCTRTKTPFIVSPHGMLEPWAWRHRAWKKRPVWWMWEKRFLRRGSALHATAQSERLNLQKLGLTNSTAVIPVGVQLSTPVAGPTRPKNEPRTALFISRIHPKKGLLNLVRAWSVVRPSGWRVVLAGPDSTGHLATVQQAIQRAGLAASFEYAGPVYGSAKWELYRSADLFVLPSHSENFGIVVAEALSCGVPVITTRETPWEELLTHRCGWWVDVTPEALADALRQAIALPATQREAMGLRGQKLVEDKYSWPSITHRMLNLYDWVLGLGSGPTSQFVN